MKGNQNKKALNSSTATEESIVLDMKIINESLIKNKMYNSKEITFKYDLKQGEDTSNLNDKHKYVVSITNGRFSYIGALNNKIERSVVGRNQYHNGDVYLGYWENNKKHKYGIYMHKPEDGQVEIYHGVWDKGVKSKEGIYIWKGNSIESEVITTDNSTPPTTIDAYIGEFEEGKFSHGLLINQTTESINSIYFGKFSKEGKKEDDSALYFISNQSQCQLFYGKLIDDDLLEGYITEVNVSNLSDISKMENPNNILFDTPFYFKKSDNNRIEVQDFNDESKIEELTTIFTNFLKVISESDFPDKINKHSLICIQEIETYNKLEKFESEANFTKNLNILTGFSYITSLIEPLYNKEILN